MSNSVVNAWIRLDRAISSFQNPRPRPATGRRLTANVRSRNKTHDSDNDLYLTMADAIRDESRHNMMHKTNHSISLSQTLAAQYDAAKITKTSGSIARSIRKIYTLRAHDRQQGVTNSQMKAYHQLQMQSEIRDLSVDKIQLVMEKAELIHHIPFENILDLYVAKCEDSDIQYLPDQAIKFIDRFKRLCGKGHMNFSNLILGANSCKIISQMLLPHVTQLDVSKNSLNETSVQHLIRNMPENYSLVSINLSHCSLSTNSIGTLLENLPKTLISLNLSYNRLSKQAAIQLNTYLEQNQLIQFLDLEECGSSVNVLKDSFKQIYKTIVSNSKSLAYLNLTHDTFEGDELIESLCYIKSLEELNLNSTFIRDSGIANLCSFVRESDSKNTWNVRVLKLEKCFLTINGLQKLCDVLPNTKIEQLFLGRNSFGHVAFLSIIGNLFKSRSLYQLDLTECNLNSQTSVGLYEMNRCSTLKKVNLSCNGFNLENSKGFTGGLKYLEYLDISKCRLGQKGGMLLVLALETNSYLEDLNISDNFIPEEVFLHMIEVLKRNKRIQKIDMSKNQYTYRTFERVAELLKKNVDYQNQLKIPKIKQQMKDLQQYDNKQDHIELEKALILQKKKEAEQDFEQEKINQELLVEKEKVKSERLRIKKDQIAEELKSLNMDYQKIHREHELELNYLDIEITKQQDQIKQQNSSTREMNLQMRQIQDHIVQLQSMSEKRLDSLKIEQSAASRRLNSAYMFLNQAQDQNVPKKEVSVSQSPKKKRGSSGKRR